jgi:Fe-S cluster assembly iron-binding protein IscA
MLEVTDKATQKVEEFFKTRQEREPLRVVVAGVG